MYQLAGASTTTQGYEAATHEGHIPKLVELYYN